MSDLQEALQRINKCVEGRRTAVRLNGLRITELPAQLRLAVNLQYLSAADCSLHTLPSWIGELRDLYIVDLSGNRLESLPDGFKELTAMRFLSMERNSGLVLADRLVGMTNLEELDISGEGLANLPDYFRTFTKLRVLRADRNRLEHLPKWISRLPALARLDVSNNRLRSLPRSPGNIGNLEVANNPDLRLPKELVESHNASRIIRYFHRTARAQDRQPLNEFKLILVGRGLVGKTTLVHKLITDKYRRFNRTPGVKITTWMNRIDDENVRAHVWDFGGQEILHGTHRFFMTERALYIVLISGREGTEDHDAEYWLSMVRSFAGDVPIIVLLHKASDFSFELNRELLREKYGRDIVFLETDSQTGKGIAELRHEIREHARKLPGLRAAWPTEWRRIKEELPAKRRNWLSFENFRAFCHSCGVTAATDQEELADSLHELGLMLSYRKEEALRHFGVLNPQWVTRGIYEMLTAPKLRENGGKFTVRSFADVLAKTKYPPKLHPFLLGLMRKFQLCHPLDEKGGQYLIPELLTKEEPKLDDDFVPEECLGFVYKYDVVLPEGLLPRFIVETYVHREPTLAWRTGVVLERDNCRALVRGDVHGGEVLVRVTGHGNGRRALLAIIREHFERIHQSYERLPVTELVPIPGHPEAKVKHDLLLKYERSGRRTIAVEVGDQLVDKSVKELLDGVDLPGARYRPKHDSRHEQSSHFRAGQATSVFVSYSHTDAAFLDQLRGALVPYERLRKLDIWADPLTNAGEKWEEQIVAHLDSAQIVILLLSNDFLRSSYCMDVELPKVMARYEQHLCAVVPVLLRACRYDLLDLGQIRAITPDGKPIAEHRNRDRAWRTVTEHLDSVLERSKMTDAGA